MSESPWELGLALVSAEITDALSGDDSSSPAYDLACIAVTDHPSPGDIATEISALAGEAIIRLAAMRTEEPAETLAWLVKSEWTSAAENDHA